ncbi:MAG: ankyrin repeat domain-containing protein [Spirochaetales bacterium]|nr:ankyrin repeat domain-containing protein [Spirochaetales bacterium]
MYCLIPVVPFLTSGCGREINGADHASRSAVTLYETALGGDYAGAARLIGRGEKPGGRFTPQAATPLHAAVRGGHEKIVALLLSSGAPVDARDRIGMTPLYYAAVHGREMIARVLIDAGASINAATKDGTLPLHAAAAGGYISIVKLLLANGALADASNILGDTPLISAIDHGHVATAALLIDHGADIMVKDKKYGWTPLHYAAASGSRESVLLLIDRGAVVTAEDEEGRTASDIAEATGDTGIFDILSAYR